MVTLYRGDCLIEMNKIPDKSVDMVLCDLPYGTTSNSWDTIIPFDKLWEQYDRVCKDNAVIALFSSQPFTSLLVCSNIKMYKHEWIWLKNRGSNFANTVREPFKEHESILIFSKGKWVYNPQYQERTGAGVDRILYSFNFRTKSENYREFSDRENVNKEKLRVPSSVQKFNTEVGLHPTQKPVPLLEYLIKTYTNRGDTVLDNCMGSGSTGRACLNLDRNFIGIELEDKYFEIAKNRLKESKEVLF